MITAPIKKTILAIPIIGPMVHLVKQSLMGSCFGPFFAMLPVRLWRLKADIRSTGNRQRYLDIHKIHWVPTKSLRYGYRAKSHSPKDLGKVIGGDWDVSMSVLASWKDAGDTPLADSMRKNGYQTQQELMGIDNLLKGEVDEITCRIGRYGNLLFQDGRHRLETAKALNIPRVAVRITARHKHWMNFREEILCSIDKTGGKSYSPLLHPDLRDIPYTHGHARLQAIKKHLTAKSGTMLDIGSHWGYFCHHFEDIGFDCMAVESDARNAYFLRKLRDASDKKFNVFEGSIFDYPLDGKIDVVLALNIFHHFVKRAETRDQLAAFLERLTFGEMYVGIHPRYKQWIIDYARCCDAKMILTTPDGRGLYKLWG